MQVRDLMSPNIISVAPDESAALAARLLKRYNVGSLPVCGEGGDLRGILTDRDIVTRCVAAEEDPGKVKVRDIMSRGCACVYPEDDVREASRMMASAQVRRLPVTEEGKVVGIITLGDIALSQAYDMEASKALADISDNIKRG